MSKTKSLVENLRRFEAGLGAAPVAAFAQDFQVQRTWIDGHFPGKPPDER